MSDQPAKQEQESAPQRPQYRTWVNGAVIQPGGAILAPGTVLTDDDLRVMGEDLFKRHLAKGRVLQLGQYEARVGPPEQTPIPEGAKKGDWTADRDEGTGLAGAQSPQVRAHPAPERAPQQVQEDPALSQEAGEGSEGDGVTVVELSDSDEEVRDRDLPENAAESLAVDPAEVEKAKQVNASNEEMNLIATELFDGVPAEAHQQGDDNAGQESR